MLVSDDRIALCGALREISLHHHASTAVVIGLDAPLRFVGHRAHRSRAALIAPGFAHSVEIEQRGRIAAFLLPVHAVAANGAPPVRDLPRAQGWIELSEAILGGSVRNYAEIDSLLARARLNTREIDDRLRRALEVLVHHLDENLAVDELASEVGLSSSRLMALTREQLGTSLRRFRRWLRLFRVARDYAGGASLTRAALDSGFASSAHLSAAAREHFGVSPSQILTPRARESITLTPLGSSVARLPSASRAPTQRALRETPTRA